MWVSFIFYNSFSTDSLSQIIGFNWETTRKGSAQVICLSEQTLNLAPQSSHNSLIHLRHICAWHKLQKARSLTSILRVPASQSHKILPTMARHVKRHVQQERHLMLVCCSFSRFIILRKVSNFSGTDIIEVMNQILVECGILIPTFSDRFVWILWKTLQ